MLSICIPIYNRDVSRLVTRLHEQAISLDIPVEVFLLDDASQPALREKNRELQSLPLVRYEELPENIGRSRIRNELARRAIHPRLLFIDCDMAVLNPDFLVAYVRESMTHEVICGGHTYQQIKPAPPFLLHWLYGRNRESAPASQRRKKPHRSFMTSNFVVNRRLFGQLSFNERLDGYGHEDTLFGYHLKQQGVLVHHVDNPLLHEGLEPAAVFLDKTRDGLCNLKTIYKMQGNKAEFAKMVKALRAWTVLKRFYLCRMVSFVFSGCRSTMEKVLAGSQPGLWILDLYKLGVLCGNSAAGNSRKTHS